MKFKKTLKILFPILLGIALIVYLYQSYTSEQRTLIYNNIKEADYKWIWLSIILGTLSHLSRAYRWKFLLEPLGCKTQFKNRAMAVLVAYFSNLGIPRSGEVLRATTISTYEKVPFEKAFGTIIAERMADLLMSFVFIGLALVVQFDTIYDLLISKIPKNPLQLTLIGLFFSIIIYIAFKLFSRSNHKIVNKIKQFLLGLKEGVASILNMENKCAFIFHTILIWVLYLLMFYVVFFAIEETKNASVGAVLTSFVTGSFTVATTNGGFIAYPIAIEETLALFGLPSEPSQAVGWLMWSAQTALTIVAGALSFFLLPILNQKK